MANAQYTAALRVVRKLHALGHVAYFAGGCVRDMLLGVAAKDFDVATSATPEQVMAAFPRTEAVGAHFGVVLVIDEAGEGSAAERVATEVATFRHDGAYTDGRRPDAVRFSDDPREDVLRRDFTINGLLLDVLRWNSKDGESKDVAEGDRLTDCVLDFVGGREDLERKIVRAIGEPERRFAEDKLRMLRAVRFAARLGFVIESRTLHAMQNQAAAIGVVSAERVRDELTKILTQGSARRGMELLDESDLLTQVLPEVKRMQGVEPPPQYHPEGDVWVHTLMLLDHLQGGPGLKPNVSATDNSGLTPASTPGEAAGTLNEAAGAAGESASPVSVTLAWGMLLHDVGKPATFTPPDPAKGGDRIRFNGHVEAGIAIARSILNRLRFSNDDCEQILSLIQHHMQFGDVMKMKQSTLKRLLRLPAFEEHLALHRADCMSSHGMLGMYDFAKAQYAELGHEAIKPTLLVTGASLIAAGFKPGPAFKAMLLAAEDAQLEGVVRTKDEAMIWVRERFPA
jgi:poly(A) polymerase